MCARRKTIGSLLRSRFQVRESYAALRLVANPLSTAGYTTPSGSSQVRLFWRLPAGHDFAVRKRAPRTKPSYGKLRSALFLSMAAKAVNHLVSRNGKGTSRSGESAGCGVSGCCLKKTPRRPPRLALSECVNHWGFFPKLRKVNEWLTQNESAEGRLDRWARQMERVGVVTATNCRVEPLAFTYPPDRSVARFPQTNGCGFVY